jgi:hypothetical protein
MVELHVPPHVVELDEEASSAWQADPSVTRCT